MQVGVRVRVIPQLEARGDPLPQQRDARGIRCAIAIQLDLVDEANRRHPVSRERIQQPLCQLLEVHEALIFGRYSGKIVDGDGQLAIDETWLRRTAASSTAISPWCEVRRIAKSMSYPIVQTCGRYQPTLIEPLTR